MGKLSQPSNLLPPPLNPGDVLDNVVFCRAHNTEDQMLLLSQAAGLMGEGGSLSFLRV